MLVESDEVSGLGRVQCREVEGEERECFRGRLNFVRVTCGGDDERTPRPFAKGSGAPRKDALDSGSDLKRLF